MLIDEMKRSGISVKKTCEEAEHGRTIYITKVLESCTEFIGNEISSKGSPEVAAKVADIDHIDKCKAIMPKA